MAKPNFLNTSELPENNFSLLISLIDTRQGLVFNSTSWLLYRVKDGLSSYSTIHGNGVINNYLAKKLIGLSGWNGLNMKFFIARSSISIVDGDDEIILHLTNHLNDYLLVKALVNDTKGTPRNLVNAGLMIRVNSDLNTSDKNIRNNSQSRPDRRIINNMQWRELSLANSTEPKP